MALPSGPTVLPFKSEKLSFCLDYKNDKNPTSQVELACVCFDRQAQVLDFIQFNRRAALNSSLKHSNCSYLPPKDVAPGDEAIHMYPFDLSPQCEVMLLLASAPHSTVLPNDLSTSKKLQFRVHARELGAQPVQLLDVDLSPLVHLPAKHQTAAAGPLSNGHQTMVIAGVYTTPQGWTLSFDCSTYPGDHWGLLLPQLRKLLQRWPALSAAAAAAQNHKLQQQVVVSSRKGSDNALSALAAWTAVQTPAQPAAGAAKNADDDTDAADAETAAGSVDDGNSSPGASGPPADATGEGGALVDAAAAPADGGSTAAAVTASVLVPAAAAGLDRLVLELGWETFRPLQLLDDEEGEEEEEPVVEFALALYNLQGEEIGSVSIDNPEFEGITLEEEPVLDEYEDDDQAGEEQQPDAAGGDATVAAEGSGAAAGAEAAAEATGEEEGGTAEQAAAEGSTGAAGAAGDDDDDGFVKEDTSASDEEKEESPEEKAAKAAAAVEAAAAAAQRAAANQRPLAEKFPLKRRVHLSLPELPADVRAMMLTVSSFGGSGFKNVKTLQARLLIAPPQQKQAAEEAKPAEEAEEGEEARPKKKKGPRPPERVLVHYRFDSVQGADAHLTQLLVLKLYKEYTDSAFAVWVRHNVPDVASLLGGAAAVEAAVVAAAAAGAATGAVDGSSAAGGSLSTEGARAVLQEVLAARKQLESDLAARRAKAEEEGLEEEEEGEYDLRLERGVWRVRVLGLSAGGESPEDFAPTVNNLLAYDGDLDATGIRISPACKVAYPNRDTFFGPYTAGAKGGTGLYVAANGAGYVGQYVAGKRCGFGLMILPDGGLYKGGFKDDKFEGQGSYLYPDSSMYTGGWKAGRKHGQGTYWDKAGGCLRGSWVSGNLKGTAQYDQPHYHFEGQFLKGLPAGPCSFSMSCDFRTSGLPQAAASYIIAPHGPTLKGEGQYSLPPGVADKGGDEEAADESAEDAGGEAEGEEGSSLPAWPKYEGLVYQSGLTAPCSTADVPFPPETAAVVAI